MWLACLNNSAGWQGTETHCSGISRNYAQTLLIRKSVWLEDIIYRSRVGRETCIGALVYVETSVTSVYILGICEARDSQNSLPQRGQLLGNGPRVCKKVQMWPFAGQAFSAKMTAGSVANCSDPWVLSFIRDILVKGWKSKMFHWAPLCIMVMIPSANCINSHWRSLGWSQGASQVAKRSGREDFL